VIAHQETTRMTIESSSSHRYPSVEPQPSFPALEREILSFWDGDHTFEASVAARDGADEYVFYDGPPFANGLPHYGHLLTGFVKDAVPRYRTMRGQQVHRRFGWDCHGLPAETVVEKELGVSGHPEILQFGLEKFNDACRTSVLRFTDDWHRYVTRQARWVDFENDYKTLDLPYMESVMWAFKSLWDKGLIYEGFRVLAYCWRCETPLSNTETRMDDVYRDRQDPALTVAFQLETGEKILAWTTTPWTLPSNLALAVGPDIDYAVMEESTPEGTQRYILAESRLGAYERELADATQVGTLSGADLVGRKYVPLFPFFADTPNAFHVLAADFVSTEDGTGVVHMAPGFGEEDQNVCNAVGIPTVCPMDEHGRYTSEVAPWAHVHVFDANPMVIKELKDRGVVVRHDSYQHSYPHCWRCAEPLVYRAISSWFVEVTRFKDRMVELNQQITWVPEHIKEGSFGKWLANARDWSISRNRFWGSPIPVWKSDDPEYPRVDVLRLDRRPRARLRRAGHRPPPAAGRRPRAPEPRRPHREVDDAPRAGGARLLVRERQHAVRPGALPVREPRVVRQPLPGRLHRRVHRPDPRLVLHAARAGDRAVRPAVVLTCVSHGIVLGDDGQKMSKSLRNYPDPMMVFDTYGSDAMRWYLLSSSILRGTDLAVTEDGIRDTVRQVMLPIWNSWYFLSLYANAEGRVGEFRTDATDVLDRYILAKTHDLVRDVTAQMDVYDLFAACGSVRVFLDVLTNWYVRRSRDRFWAGEQAAIDTLHTVLTVLCRVAAPLLPLTTEAVYRQLTGERSVHLADWPEASTLPADDELVATMDLARDVCSATLRVRKAHQRRVRLPLAEPHHRGARCRSARRVHDLIADEVNVKAVQLTDDVASVATHDLQVVPAALGPRLGGRTQQVIKAVKSGDWRQDGDTVVAGGIELQPGEYQLKLVVAGDGASTSLSGGAGVVVLDTEVTPELEAEGRPATSCARAAGPP
jgi:isoleucyl-tRNA synthetase